MAVDLSLHVLCISLLIAIVVQYREITKLQDKQRETEQFLANTLVIEMKTLDIVEQILKAAST